MSEGGDGFVGHFSSGGAFTSPLGKGSATGQFPDGIEHGTEETIDEAEEHFIPN